jgi:hypothetical protein
MGLYISQTAVQAAGLRDFPMTTEQHQAYCGSHAERKS